MLAATAWWQSRYEEELAPLQLSPQIFNTSSRSHSPTRLLKGKVKGPRTLVTSQRRLRTFCTELQVCSKLVRQILQRLQVAHSKCVGPPGKHCNQAEQLILMKERHDNDGANAEFPARIGIYPGVQRRITAELHCSARSAYTCKA